MTLAANHATSNILRRSSMRRLISFVVPALAIAACHRGTQAPSMLDMPVTSARGTLRLADGREVGGVTLTQTIAGVLVSADLSSLPSGTHGIHFHAIGQCTGTEFASAGGHFNPAMKMHGLRNANGPHAGDLPNIHVPEGGRLRVELLAPNVRLGAGAGTLFDGDGAAIVIHALADDYQTDPAGGSGTRIACAVLDR
ncbi:MAG: superoxide dismutase family protein [Deltaproteobacteria bacterium]|nr:superoxide dismutase family protein [Nannocystaceae bacterium]